MKMSWNESWHLWPLYASLSSLVQKQFCCKRNQKFQKGRFELKQSSKMINLNLPEKLLSLSFNFTEKIYSTWNILASIINSWTSDTSQRQSGSGISASCPSCCLPVWGLTHPAPQVAKTNSWFIPHSGTAKQWHWLKEQVALAYNILLLNADSTCF